VHLVGADRKEVASSSRGRQRGADDENLQRTETVTTA
jgi:hypothetical protein